jgi:hypothetical protein
MDKRDIRRTPLLYVEWHDACSDGGWHREDEVPIGCPRIISVGWKLRETKRALTIGTDAEHNGKGGGGAQHSEGLDLEEATAQGAHVNHKRKRPKHLRAGCLLCKPWKDERGAAGMIKGLAVRGRAMRLPPSQQRKVQPEDKR